MNKIILSACVLSLMFSCKSSAQTQERQREQPPSFEELLEKMDTNKDGKLAKAEIKGRLKDDFDKIDTNKDGFISEDEFKKAPKSQGPQNGGQGGPPRN